MKTILGAGLAGLSCSYHLGHEECIIFEKNTYAGGHIYSNRRDGFVWDEGIHISFTKDDYVRNLFAKSVQDEFIEFDVNVANYFKGDWIPHPAQSNLFAVSEPHRTECLNDFLRVRNDDQKEDRTPKNYDEWLNFAFGSAFSKSFPTAYTRKYWTCEPEQLAIDWLGKRVFFPDIETVINGYKKAPQHSTHYITNVRYPKKGGYDRFAAGITADANIHYGHCVESINFDTQLITFTNGAQHHYDELINTMPLPELIHLGGLNVPLNVRNAAQSLRCSSLLLVNVTAKRKEKNPFHYFYVYDEDKYSTRITHTDMLSTTNTPKGKTGIQVEVYESRYKPFKESHSDIAFAVVDELKEMGLIENAESVHTHYVPYANVIFDLKRRESQNEILSWLEGYGLVREDDDLEPMTDWTTAVNVNRGKLALAGRFGQWKYFWTDDCILRGKQFGKN
jgi:protoporphyrinogen oxidase